MDPEWTSWLGLSLTCHLWSVFLRGESSDSGGQKGLDVVTYGSVAFHGLSHTWYFGLEFCHFSFIRSIIREWSVIKMHENDLFHRPQMTSSSASKELSNSILFMEKHWRNLFPKFNFYDRFSRHSYETFLHVYINCIPLDTKTTEVLKFLKIGAHICLRISNWEKND